MKREITQNKCLHKERDKEELTENTGLKFYEFPGFNIPEAKKAGDPISYREHTANFASCALLRIQK